jgi:DNA-binding MarR family transcriptional regulator
MTVEAKITQRMRTMRTRTKALKRGVKLSEAVPVGRSRKSSVFKACANTSTCGDNDHGPLPLQQLLRIARQSGIAEPLACASSLTLLTTSRAVHHCLLRILKSLDLSEGLFEALVTLYALDPIPTSSADLAYHTETTRPAMAGLLDMLEERGWIRRNRRLNTDRRFSRISLTEVGREVTTSAIRRFLRSAAEIAEDLKPGQHILFEKLCTRLRRRSMSLGL